MRLIDIDDFARSAGAGKSTMLKLLEKYAAEHPVIDIPVDAYSVHINVKEKTIALEKITK